jgi:hypothetical protein
MGERSIARKMRTNRHFLDEDSASRLMQGLVHPDDAPPGYGAVAGLLNSAARLPLGPVDEDAATATVSAMVEVIRVASPAPEISRRKSMLSKLLAAKALAAVAVIGLTASGAAAATGSLPDQAQSVVSDALSHVGVNVPHPDHGNSASHRKDSKGHKGDENQAGDDQGQSGDADKGMSTTVSSLKSAPRSDDAGPLGQDVCKVASNGACVHDEKGESADHKSDDHGAPAADDQGGKSGDDHPGETPADDHATTPTTGSIVTGEEHSEKAELPVGTDG